MGLTIAGLGPGNPNLLTAGALEAIALADVVYLRTTIHPTIPHLPGGPEYRSFDAVYDASADFETLYATIADTLLAESKRADVVYAVPGDPSVAEASVRKLRQAFGAAGQPVRLVSGVSFIEPALAVLGLDALEGGLQLLDAAEPRADTRLPALFAQVFNRAAASRLKLALLESYPPDHVVTVVSGAGSESERAEEVVLAELDWEERFDHLTCVYVPALPAERDTRTFAGLERVVRRLHAEDGCPWDREQTHQSLKPHLLEESYEVLAALDEEDIARLPEELGDLLLQVLMHAAVAEREQEFTFQEVVESIATKLIRRHPHVFGDAVAEDAEQVYQNWEALKRTERGGAGALDGVPTAMPALAYSQAVQSRAARLGFDWPDIEGPLEKMLEELRELASSQPSERAGEFGDVLFTVVATARKLGVEAEEALRLANRKFYRRFSRMEQVAQERGVPLESLSLEDQDALWDQAKAEGL